MSIPTFAQLLRQPNYSQKPEPAAVFAPFLTPGETILWAGQPDAECSCQQQFRGANLLFGGIVAVCALPAALDYCLGPVSKIDIYFLWHTPFFLLCLVVVRAYIKSSVPGAYFAVTNRRLLSYHSEGDGPDFSSLPLGQITRLSVKNLPNGCGSIRFNQRLLKAQNHSLFTCIENVEAIAALILEAKHKIILAGERGTV